MLKMLKGLVSSPKKQVQVEVEVEVKDCKEKKEYSLRPQEGSLTDYWIKKNKN